MQYCAPIMRKRGAHKTSHIKNMYMPNHAQTQLTLMRILLLFRFQYRIANEASKKVSVTRSSAAACSRFFASF